MVEYKTVLYKQLVKISKFSHSVNNFGQILQSGRINFTFWLCDQPFYLLNLAQILLIFIFAFYRRPTLTNRAEKLSRVTSAKGLFWVEEHSNITSWWDMKIRGIIPAPCVTRDSQR